MSLRIQKKTFYSALLLALLGIFSGQAAFAISWNPTDWPAEIISGLLSIVIAALGQILILVIQGLVAVASYQNFIGSQAVILGWVIVRDVCNMFFVVILMIIAFGTILHIEDYNYKKWLPKLIMMAILINFSKTICGLLIDVAQVVMLTFVNAFKDIGGANLVDILGIEKVIRMATNTVTNETDYWMIAGAYILGTIYLIIAVVVIATMMMMLVMRLIMIWIYVVLSPAAYLLAAFPGGEKYSSQWWDEFIKNLISGPVLAFFIWLSLAALSTTANSSSGAIGTDIVSSSYSEQAEEDLANLKLDAAKTASEASTPSALISFVVAIGMLVGGLKIASEIGGAAGKLAGKGMSKLQSGAAFAGNIGKKAALLPAKGLMLGASYGADKLHEKTGIDLNLKRSWNTMQATRKDLQAKRYSEGQLAARKAMESGGRVHGILAMTGNSGDAYEQLTSLRGVKKRLKGGQKMQEDLTEASQEKKSADKELDQLQYEEKYMNLDGADRQKVIDEANDKVNTIKQSGDTERATLNNINQQIADEEAKGDYKDTDLIKELQDKKAQSQKNLSNLDQEQADWEGKRDYASSFQYYDFSSKQKHDIRTQRKDAANKVNQAQEKIENNIPDYNYDARAAEQKVVGAQMAKIKDISDSSELLSILNGAIKSHDKTMIKAIMLKMSKDGNDNEFLRPLTGRTDHIGLKDLMRQLSTEGSKNYANFDEQEAFGLGSQIAEINKGTNHWAATSAYEMENGRWRETTEEEHNKIRDAETAKQQQQSFIRSNGRLAYGLHDSSGKFHLDVGGVIKLKGLNNQSAHEDVGKTMNESAAKHIYEALHDKGNEKLLEYFSERLIYKDKDGKEVKGDSLVSALEKRLGVIAQTGKIEEKIQSAKDLMNN